MNLIFSPIKSVHKDILPEPTPLNFCALLNRGHLTPQTFAILRIFIKRLTRQIDKEPDTMLELTSTDKLEILIMLACYTLFSGFKRYEEDRIHDKIEFIIRELNLN